MPPPGGKSFSVKDPEIFTIKSVVSRWNLDQSWFSIIFESGKTAYLNAKTLMNFRYEGVAAGNTLDRSHLSIATRKVFFEEPPNIVFDRINAAIDESDRQRESKKVAAEKEEKKRIARGKARIGMTKAQAINSSWGNPTSVNTTILNGVIHEQWVYGVGNYLYFTNGRLSAIQESE